MVQQYKDQEQRHKDLQQLVSQEEQLAQYRQSLKEDEECPLCGASHHPNITDMDIDVPDTIARKQQAELLINQLEQEGRAVRESLDSLNLKINDMQARLVESNKHESRLMEQWQLQAKTLN